MLATMAIYHRRGNDRTQTDADAERIATSGELWGRAPRYGTVPAVQAYVGELPDNSWGVEFRTPVPPDPSDSPWRATWRGPRLGVTTWTDEHGTDWVKIMVHVTRIARKER